VPPSRPGRRDDTNVPTKKPAFLPAFSFVSIRRILSARGIRDQ
jgi:hypothetical protein